jgi:hypothetical protein
MSRGVQAAPAARQARAIEVVELQQRLDERVLAVGQ